MLSGMPVIASSIANLRSRFSRCPGTSYGARWAPGSLSPYLPMRRAAGARSVADAAIVRRVHAWRPGVHSSKTNISAILRTPSMGCLRRGRHPAHSQPVPRNVRGGQEARAMTPDQFPAEEQNAATRRPYEPPAVIEVFVDPAKDMLVACRPGKLPNQGRPVVCNAVQFT